MGCVPSKAEYFKLENSVPKSLIIPGQGIYFHNEQDPFVKFQLLDSIKKNDIILFQRLADLHSVKPTELLSSINERKAIIHYIAQYNFYEAMILILSRLSNISSSESYSILNSRDAEGNTCISLSGLYNSFRTLEAILSTDQADTALRNYTGKTALDIALEEESPCAKLLSCYITKPTYVAVQKSLNALNASISQKSTQMGMSLKGVNDKAVTMESPILEAEKRKLTFTSELTYISLGEIPNRTPYKRISRKMDTLKQSKTDFIDSEFPHDDYSVASQAGFSESLGYQITWNRANTIFGSDVKLFSQIKTGFVDNSLLVQCDLYAVLAALSEFPQRITKIFTVPDTNPFGLYSIEMLVCGIPVEVLVDDYFPCGQDGQPMLSSTNNKELWFMLIEKAMAKLYGCYADLDKIDAVEAFEVLTGMPTMKKSIKGLKEEILWNMLEDWNKRGYIVCIGRHEEESNKNRYFTVVGEKFVGEERWVKMKAYYGDDEAINACEERKKSWSKKFREEVGCFDLEKDCFFMNTSELYENFDFLVVCCYQEGWTRNKIEVKTSPKDVTYTELIVDAPTEIFVSIHQKKPCFVNNKNYRISPVEIMLVEDQEVDCRFIGCGGDEAFKGKQTIYVGEEKRLNLEKGRYIIRSKIHWKDGRENDFTINTFSHYPVRVRTIDSTKCLMLLERTFTDIGMKTKQKYFFSNNCVFASAVTDSHLWIYGKNSGKKVWYLEIIFDQLENMKIPKRFRNQPNSILLEIPPGQRGVAFAKRESAGEIQINWHFNQGWEDPEN